MNANESWTLRVKKTIEYTSIDGTTKSISPGKHQITAIRAEGVPTGETELECWIVKEDRGAEGEIAHDVDAETVSGRIEVELPKGVRAYQPEAREAATSPPDGYDCVVAARSVSGRVRVSEG